MLMAVLSGKDYFSFPLRDSQHPTMYGNRAHCAVPLKPSLRHDFGSRLGENGLTRP
jgi:hypothetical protein